jgi:predicted DNA-binding protein (MmcQ/YjbR family)
MTVESLQSICKKLPKVTEDVKWGNDLCFCVAKKMFLVIGLHENPASASFKVKDEEFDELSNRSGFMPAPYVARYKWVLVKDINTLSKKDWEHYAKQSYELVRDKLSKKVRNEFGV